MKSKNLSKEKIFIVGGGGHSKVIIAILKKIGNYDIFGFTDNVPKNPILGISYIGSDDVIPDLYMKGLRKAAIGVGQIKSSETRISTVNVLTEIGFEFPAIISPHAVVNEDVQIGRGTVIMDGAVINSGTIIGEFSIINTNCSVDHDCKIGSFTHIAPGVTLSGEVEIGANVLIGTGANIIQQVKIVDGCIVSAGSSVQKSLLKKGIYRGVSAMLVKTI